MPTPHPIITFTTDFGLHDSYVAEMKAAALRWCPEAQLLDVTHLVPPQNVLAGSIILANVLDAFPAGTVHVAVIDPGVGTNRRLLVVEYTHQRILLPDNGLISWAAQRHVCRAFELSWRPDTASTTFHGRDILAPAAGQLAAGVPRSKLADRSVNPILLDLPRATDDAGEIIYIDHFGNAITNLTAGHPGDHVYVGHNLVGEIHRTYADVPSGRPLALFGSHKLLEIAINGGSAANQLKLNVGDRVMLKRAGTQ